MIDYPFSMQNIAVVSNIAQATWDQETIQEISQGKITIPEQTVNDFLQNQDYSSSEIKGIAVSSHEDSLDVHMKMADVGRVEMSGGLSSFEYEKGRLVMTYEVHKKTLPDKKVLSFVFSRISLAMTQKLLGHAETGDQMEIEIHGNTVTVSMNGLDENSDLAKGSAMGKILAGHLVISQAECREGYFVLSVSSDILPSL